MHTLAIIYHSAHGHTEHIARHVQAGALTVAGIEARLIKAEDMLRTPEKLISYDGLIFGSPTYLGGVSGTFKHFMDSTGRLWRSQQLKGKLAAGFTVSSLSTGRLWRSQQLKGKLAAGFTVSSLPAGDKQSTLLSMFIFSVQHGMWWVGNPILPEQHSGVPYDEAANRLGSWSGLMAQAGHAAAADAFAPGDVKTAHLFGQNFAQSLTRVAVVA